MFGSENHVKFGITTKLKGNLQVQDQSQYQPQDGIGSFGTHYPYYGVLECIYWVHYGVAPSPNYNGARSMDQEMGKLPRSRGRAEVRMSVVATEYELQESYIRASWALQSIANWSRIWTHSKLAMVLAEPITTRVFQTFQARDQTSLN